MERLKIIIVLIIILKYTELENININYIKYKIYGK